MPFLCTLKYDFLSAEHRHLCLCTPPEFLNHFLRYLPFKHRRDNVPHLWGMCLTERNFPKTSGTGQLRQKCRQLQDLTGKDKSSFPTGSSMFHLPAACESHHLPKDLKHDC